MQRNGLFDKEQQAKHCRVDSSHKCDKLIQSCKKYLRRGLKFQFFSWPSIYLILYVFYTFTIIEVKIASFNNILPD